MNETHHETIDLLCQAYSMEIETVMNYIANSTRTSTGCVPRRSRSPWRPMRLRRSPRGRFGRRIKQLGGLVPGSAAVEVGRQVQPPEDTTDVVGVIDAVIKAEEAACAQYNKIIKATDGRDYVTQDLCIRLLADEEDHLILFRGYLKEYRKD